MEQTPHRTPDPSDLAEILLTYLERTHRAVVATLDGLSEHDVRRPMTPTGTNLLGLVKHLASVELGYLGDCVGRPHGIAMAWDDEAAYAQGADMYATAEESREELLDLFARALEHTRGSVRELGLDAPATVPWWAEPHRQTTLGRLLVHTVEETGHHAGHMEIVRELIDGRAGRDHDEVGDQAWWSEYVGRVQAAADAHRDG